MENEEGTLGEMKPNHNDETFAVMDIHILSNSSRSLEAPYWKSELKDEKMTPTSVYLCPADFVYLKVLSRSR